ncbi:MAG: hypothetical protein LBC20_05370 [Planctomycetaceae bacterium]|jgi:hypothetical protein|nr:hypothetical protein [Planctomycetaceae bacterium]
MKKVLLFFVLLVVILFAELLNAQPNAASKNAAKPVTNNAANNKAADNGNNKNKSTPSKTGRVDLKTRTLVSKKLNRIDERPDGKKVYHYTYRVEAEPTVTEMPRYCVDTQYNVAYEQEGFQEEDSVTILSDNEESATDSPVWVYDVAYVDSGERALAFATTGSALGATFSSANSETDPNDPDYHCHTCNHYDSSQCTIACRCCCSTGDENCNCSGCQYQNPRCFACPVGCTCEHCVCNCDGCLTQNPRCFVCPVGCTCEHCQCLCLQSIDHEGRCGCAICKQRPLTCECECHCICP